MSATRAAGSRFMETALTKALLASGRLRRRFHVEIVHEAPGPVLPFLEAPDDRMMGRVVVLRRVLAGRIIAAAYVAAREAKAKVNPMAPGREALFASGGRPGFHRVNLADVTTGLGHAFPPSRLVGRSDS